MTNKQGGHNAHIPNDISRKMVSNLVKYLSMTQVQIAEVVGIDVKTLRKHYKTELTTAHIDQTINLARNAYVMALEGNVPMTIFLLKTRAGYIEPKTIMESEDTEEQTKIDKIEVTLAQAPNNKEQE